MVELENSRVGIEEDDGEGGRVGDGAVFGGVGGGEVGEGLVEGGDKGGGDGGRRIVGF